MKVEKFTFDQLPNAVRLLLNEVGQLKKMLATLSDQQNTTTTNEPEFITIKEACEILNVSAVTLWRYEKQGKVNVYGIGGRRLLKRDEVLGSLTLKK